MLDCDEATNEKSGVVSSLLVFSSLLVLQLMAIRAKANMIVFENCIWIFN